MVKSWVPILERAPTLHSHKEWTLWGMDDCMEQNVKLGERGMGTNYEEKVFINLVSCVEMPCTGGIIWKQP